MLEVYFETKSLQKLCSSGKEMRKRLGDRTARLLQLRLTQMQAADTLDDLRKFPSLRCHELTGNRKGQLAIDLVHPQRLILVPFDDPPPTKADGGLDWSKVTKVCVRGIVDYH